MDSQPTCGKGLAQNAGLPARMAEVIGALAAVLETHLPTIDTGDEAGRLERDAYVSLARGYRRIADELATTGAQMAGYRDLPMARHVESALADRDHESLYEVFMLKRLLLVLCCACLAGCAGEDRSAAGNAADSLSRAERDSVLGQSSVPGGSAVGRALETADIAEERAAQMDSIEP